MKTKIFYIGSLLVVVLLIVGAYASKRIPDAEAMLRVGYNASGIDDAPIMVAYDANILRKNNLKVVLIPLKSGKEIQQALALGEVDIGFAGATNFFIPISKGAAVKILGPSLISPISVFVNPNSNIKSFKDLIGKTVASRLGSSSNLALAYALLKEGINLSSVEFVDIESVYRPIALMEKKIVDAAVAGEDDKKIYQDLGAVMLEEWITKGYADRSFPRTVIAVNTDFMGKNEKAVEFFIASFIEAQRFIKDNPEESASLVANHIRKESAGAINFSTEDVKETWGKLQYVLWYESSAFAELSKLTKEIGDTETTLTSDQIFDLRFEEILKNAQEEIYPNR